MYATLIPLLHASNIGVEKSWYILHEYAVKHFKDIKHIRTTGI